MKAISRRQALAGVASGMMIVKPETAFGYQANSAVSYGVIGTGGRGVYVGTHMANVAGTRLVAICDIFPDRIDNGKTKIPGGAAARAYRDYHELLAQAEIDAVLITTPVYLHPEHFEAAVAARKHIYCEKPAGADVAGVKRLLKANAAADKSKTIQFGLQQRFSPEYLTAMQHAKTGKIGEIKMMMSYWVLGGVPPKPAAAPQKPPTEEEKIRRWGSWMETSGGFIVEQDCHGVDMLNWFAGDRHPLHARGTGSLRYPLGYGDQDSDHHEITYFYPNGLEGWLISIKNTAGFRDVKEQFYGSAGMLETARTYYKLHGPIPNSPYKNADDLTDSSLIERRTSTREITIDAVEAFFASIRESKPYNLAPVAADATYTSILGRMAYQLKREVTWDEMLKLA
uniref:Oxidoreductase domain protein n=1 Tax=Solibacter usitatus (strain Ellin6076) TaxID=234267 RepID=Q01ZD4_SOLUE